MVCDPNAAGTNPAPTAAAEPCEDAPGVRVASNGLTVGPVRDIAYSVDTVIPAIRAPALRSLLTALQSSFGMRPAWIGVPHPHS